MTTHCLNEYHLQFLRELIKRKVRFLVIGGQARSIHFGGRTRDLDVWVDICKENRPALDLGLIAWATEHPMHSSQTFALPSPLPLRPGVQIKFPDNDAAYLGADGEPKEIGPEDCIDVLTSIGSARFREFYDRAHWLKVEGLRLPFLAITDFDAISPRKA